MNLIIPLPNKVGGGTLDSPYPSVCRQHGFTERKSSLLWNFNFKFHVHVDCGHRQKPINFQWCHFQNSRTAKQHGTSVLGTEFGVKIWEYGNGGIWYGNTQFRQKTLLVSWMLIHTFNIICTHRSLQLFYIFFYLTSMFCSQTERSVLPFRHYCSIN